MVASEPHALGRVLSVGSAPLGPFLLVSGGYGYTESVLHMGDAHHRVAGAVAVHERPVPWLDLALRLDGRYDAHNVPGQRGDSGFVGDPRFFARVERGRDRGLSLGARLGVWLPGRNAPSVERSALSPELMGIASYVPPGSAIALTANLGYRLDRSAHSAPDAAMLSASDRLALGVSAFDQLLVGVAATVGRDSAQGFVEALAHVLVGNAAPGVGASPMFLAAGGRFAVARDVRLEAAIDVSPSRRPDTSPSAPLSPIPPRFAVWFGLSYRFGAASPSNSSRPATPDAAAVVASAPGPLQPAALATASASLMGRVSSASAQPRTLADLRVAIAAGDQRREVTVDDNGRFTAEGTAGEVLAVSVEAADHLPASATVKLRPGANQLDIALKPRSPGGHIRGLIRSLRGAAVAAQVAIETDTPAGTEGQDSQSLRAEDGRFEVEVAPGRYRVTISAPGFDVQARRIEVEENGVTLLNVDLRRER